MGFSTMKLLLSFVLSVAVWSCAEAEKEVTVESIDINVADNEMIKSWNGNVDNKFINCDIDVGKNCPEPFEAEIKVYQGDTVVSTVKESFDRPMKKIEQYGVCESIDCPEPDDDSCSIADGVQSLNNCDVSSYFSDKSNGPYTVVITLTQNNNEVATVTLKINVEGE